MCLQLIHFAVREKPTHHWKATTHHFKTTTGESGVYSKRRQHAPGVLISHSLLQSSISHHSTELIINENICPHNPEHSDNYVYSRRQPAQFSKDDLQKCSAESDSLQPHGPQPARLLCLWDSPGKDTGVGCLFLLQEKYIAQVCVLSRNSFAYFKVTTLKNYLPPRFFFFFFSILGKRERKQDMYAPNRKQLQEYWSVLSQ